MGPLLTFRGDPSAPVQSLSFDDTNQYLAVGYEDGTVSIWDVRACQKVLVREAWHGDRAVLSVHWMPHLPSLLMTHGRDGVIRFLHFEGAVRVEDDQVIAGFVQRSIPCSSSSFAAATVDSFGFVFYVDANDPEVITQRYIALSSKMSSRNSNMDDGGIDTYACKGEKTGPIMALAVSRTIVSCSFESGHIAVYEKQSRTCMSFLKPHSAMPLLMTIHEPETESSNGQHAAVVLSAYADGQLGWYTEQAGKWVTASKERDGCAALQVCAQHRCFFAGYWNNCLAMYGLSKKMPHIVTLPCDLDGIRALSLSHPFASLQNTPAESRHPTASLDPFLAAGGKNGNIEIWKIA